MDVTVGSSLDFDQAHSSLRRIRAMADLLAATDIEKLDAGTLEEVAAILACEALLANHAFRELRDSAAQKLSRHRKLGKRRLEK